MEVLSSQIAELNCMFVCSKFLSILQFNLISTHFQDHVTAIGDYSTNLNYAFNIGWPLTKLSLRLAQAVHPIAKIRYFTLCRAVGSSELRAPGDCNSDRALVR
jgi:hypothetical protein